MPIISGEGYQIYLRKETTEDTESPPTPKSLYWGFLALLCVLVILSSPTHKCVLVFTELAQSGLSSNISRQHNTHRTQLLEKYPSGPLSVVFTCLLSQENSLMFSSQSAISILCLFPFLQFLLEYDTVFDSLFSLTKATLKTSI